MKIAAAALILSLMPLEDAAWSKDPELRRISRKLVTYPITAIVLSLMEETGIPIEFDGKAKKLLENDDSDLSVDVEQVTVLDVLHLICMPRNLKAVPVDKMKVVITADP